MNIIGVIILIMIFIMPWFYVVVFFFPIKNWLRIYFLESHHINLEWPQLCIVTGEKATKICVITKTFIFTTHTGNVQTTYASKVRIPLPFSEIGWKKYKDYFPDSVKLFERVKENLFDMGLWGFGFTIWQVVSLPILGVIAIKDLLLHRRQFIRIHDATIENDILRAISFSVTNEKFANEFIRTNAHKNPQISFDEFKKRHLRPTNQRFKEWTIALIIICLFMGGLILLAYMTI